MLWIECVLVDLGYRVRGKIQLLEQGGWVEVVGGRMKDGVW